MSAHTEAGKQAQKWPGLFAGETDARRGEWVERIEREAIALHKRGEYEFKNEFVEAWPKPKKRPRVAPYRAMRDGYEYDSSDQ